MTNGQIIELEIMCLPYWCSARWSIDAPLTAIIIPSLINNNIPAAHEVRSRSCFYNPQIFENFEAILSLTIGVRCKIDPQKFQFLRVAKSCAAGTFTLIIRVSTQDLVVCMAIIGRDLLLRYKLAPIQAQAIWQYTWLLPHLDQEIVGTVSPSVALVLQ